MPPEDNRLSTSIVTDLAEADILEIGKVALRKHRQGRLYGRAEVDLRAILSQGLKAYRDDRPARHVNVVGWPPHDKAKVKSIAIELSSHASLKLLPTPIARTD